MNVVRKSLHRSANSRRAKKFANMRAAKERKRLERVAREEPLAQALREALLRTLGKYV
jgi:hypothetical protein